MGLLRRSQRLEHCLPAVAASLGTHPSTAPASLLLPEAGPPCVCISSLRGILCEAWLFLPEGSGLPSSEVKVRAGEWITRYGLIHPARFSIHNPRGSLSLWRAQHWTLQPPAVIIPQSPSPSTGTGGSHWSRTRHRSRSVFHLLDFTDQDDLTVIHTCS